MSCLSLLVCSCAHTVVQHSANNCFVFRTVIHQNFKTLFWYDSNKIICQLLEISSTHASRHGYCRKTKFNRHIKIIKNSTYSFSFIKMSMMYNYVDIFHFTSSTAGPKMSLPYCKVRSQCLCTGGFMFPNPTCVC